MNLTGNADVLVQNLRALCPSASVAVLNSGRIKCQMLEYQSLALFKLASDYNFTSASILEIGTLAGYSASIMAQAAPKATITTLNPKEWEVYAARDNLTCYKNVTVLQGYSWDYLAGYTGHQFDMIFVDGDHNRIARDLPWYQHLRVGGLMLFHDYSQAKSGIVFAQLNVTANKYEHPFDVYLMDSQGNGMVGFYKRAGEVWD